MRKLFFTAAISFTAAVASAQCPKISTNSESFEYKDGQQVLITATADTKADISYNWSVSAGTITSGQGTSVITVDSKGLAGQTVTATVDIGGLPRECSTTSSVSVSITEAPLKPGKAKAKTKKTVKRKG
jgi:hypothetical protein